MHTLGTSADTNGVNALDKAHSPMLSIITPAYNEALNLPVLYQELTAVLSSLTLEWEWIIVDDHSGDETFTIIEQIANRDPRVRGFRFARNFGSHRAVTCGLRNARGNCAAVMAADLQDPPATLPALLKQWDSGAQVVWAVRSRREGEKVSTIGFARLYYFLMRRLVGLHQMPPTGADYFLIDRRVMDALSQFKENDVSIFALITWMGFRQSTITYDKKPRLHGTSGWTLEKKLKLVVDSITSFTYLPIRMMSYLGFLVALVGFLYAAAVIFNAITGNPAQGWSSLMIVVLVIGGIQMLMMGILGEYLWRALAESRQRPQYLIEATTITGQRVKGEG